MFVLWWCGVCCEWVIELGTAHKGESLPCCVCIGKCEQAVWVSDVFQGGKDLEERVWSLLVLWSVHWWLLAELVYLIEWVCSGVRLWVLPSTHSYRTAGLTGWQTNSEVRSCKLRLCSPIPFGFSPCECGKRNPSLPPSSCGELKWVKN